MSKTQEVWGGGWRNDSLITSRIHRFHPSPLHHLTVGWRGHFQQGAEGVPECSHCDLKTCCCLCYLQMMVEEAQSWVAWILQGMRL